MSEASGPESVNRQRPGATVGACVNRRSWPDYERARQLATQGRQEEARVLYQELEETSEDRRLRALVRNDLATLDALAGDRAAARRGLQAALDDDPACGSARSNLALLAEDRFLPESAAGGATSRKQAPVKVAILSFLFNWPSTGGGIVHTVELAHFLNRAGYTVHHIFRATLAGGSARSTRTCRSPARSWASTTRPGMHRQFRTATVRRSMPSPPITC